MVALDPLCAAGQPGPGTIRDLAGAGCIGAVLRHFRGEQALCCSPYSSHVRNAVRGQCAVPATDALLRVRCRVRGRRSANRRFPVQRGLRCFAGQYAGGHPYHKAFRDAQRALTLQLAGRFPLSSGSPIRTLLCVADLLRPGKIQRRLLDCLSTVEMSQTAAPNSAKEPATSNSKESARRALRSKAAKWNWLYNRVLEPCDPLSVQFCRQPFPFKKVPPGSDAFLRTRESPAQSRLLSAKSPLVDSERGACTQLDC